MAQGLRDLLDDGYALKVVEPDEVIGTMNQSVAVVMLTEVDYRTARLHDMTEGVRRQRTRQAPSRSGTWRIRRAPRGSTSPAAMPISRWAAPTSI